MQFLSVSMREHLLVIFILAAITTAMLGMLASNTLITNLASYPDNIATIIQAKAALWEGQLPLRVAPGENLGWGYPLFQFTSPTSYMFAALIYKFISPLNPYVAYKILLWCSVLAAGLYMFYLTLWLYASRVAALLTSCVYLCAPYYIIVINHTADFNEALALGIVPSVLFYTLRCFYARASLQTFLPLACAWYLLLTVHLMTFLFTSLFVTVLLTMGVLQQPKSIPNLLRTLMPYLFSLLLGLWFLAPQLFLNTFLNTILFYNSGDMFANLRPLFANLVSPIQNITPRVFTADGVVETGLIQLHPNLGLPILFGFLVAGYGLMQRAKTGNSRADFWVLPLLLTFAAAFVLACSSKPWSGFMHYFMMGNYYWRMLGQLMWLGALLFAWSLCWFFQNKLTPRHAVLGVFLIMLATASWLDSPEKNPVALNLPEILNGSIQKNPDAFLMNVKHYHQINFIDKLSLKLNNKDNNVLFNHQYTLPLSSFAAYPRSMLVLQGAWTTENKIREVSAYLNNRLIKTWQITPGNFRWEIQVGEFAQMHSSGPLLFELRAPHAPQGYAINMESVSAAGYLDPRLFQSVSETNKSCQRSQGAMLCKFTPSASIKLVELPVLYYPHMLHITRNGKNVSYASMLYNNYLLAVVTPEAGENNFRIEFTGLAWANAISAISWWLWIILLVFLGLRQVQTGFRRKRFSHPALNRL